MEVRGWFSGDRISGFWSREVVEHVCGFGFIRRSLDLRRSDKLSLGLHRAMVAARCRGV